MRLVDLPEIYARLQTTAPGVSLEYKLYKADLEMFNSCVVRRMEDERSSRLHELAEFQKQKQAGERACATHAQFYMKVANAADFINGTGVVRDFSEDVKMVEGIAADVPLLILGDLNSLPNTVNLLTN